MRTSCNKPDPLRFLAGLVLLMLASFGVAFAGPARKPWMAPKRYARRKNPVAVNAASIEEGRQLYVKNCLSCHGLQGAGDGPAASGLDVHPGNLTDRKRMATQTDGEIFFKIRTGRRPMPSFRKTLKTKQIWAVANYVRTLAGQKLAPTPGWFEGAAPALSPDARGQIGKLMTGLLAHYESLRDAVGKDDAQAAASAGKSLLESLAGLQAVGGPAKFQKEAHALAALATTHLKGIEKGKMEICRKSLSQVSSHMAEFLGRYRPPLREPWALYLHPVKDAQNPLAWLQRGTPPVSPYARDGTSAGAVLTATFGKIAKEQD